MIGQHAVDIQVLYYEPVVGLDQLIGDLVQEMAAHIGDAMMMPPQLGGGIRAVAGSFLLARQRFRQAPLPFDPDGQHLGASVMRRPKCRQSEVNTDPTAIVAWLARWMDVGGVHLGRLDIQRYPPAARVVAGGGEQNLRAALCKHAPQPTGVISHPDLPDTRQRHRALAVVVADPDC
jgi:hypothetical protein